MLASYSLKNLKPKDRAIISRSLIFSKSRGAKNPALFNDAEFMTFPNTYGDLCKSLPIVNNDKYMFDRFVQHCVKAIKANPALSPSSAQRIVTALESSPYSLNKQHLLYFALLGISFALMVNSLSLPDDLPERIEALIKDINTEPSSSIGRFFKSYIDKKAITESRVKEFHRLEFGKLHFGLSFSTFLAANIIYYLSRSFGISYWLDNIETALNNDYIDDEITNKTSISTFIIKAAAWDVKFYNNITSNRYSINQILSFMSKTIDRSIYAFDNLPDENFSKNADELLLSIIRQRTGDSDFEDFINFCAITVNFSTNLSEKNISYFDSKLYNYKAHAVRLGGHGLAAFLQTLQFIAFNIAIKHPLQDEMHSKYSVPIYESILAPSLLFLISVLPIKEIYTLSYVSEEFEQWIDSIYDAAKQIIKDEDSKAWDKPALKYGY